MHFGLGQKIIDKIRGKNYTLIKIKQDVDELTKTGGMFTLGQEYKANNIKQII